jgi:putative transposase
MANTYSQIYIQTVFAVDGRLSLIRPEFKEDLYRYITGIVRNSKQKLIAINGMSDHIHILIGLKPSMALADLVQDIKVDSSKFINKKRWVRGRFCWQEGYGAFSLLRTFATGHDHWIHSKSGATSSAVIIQG